MKIKSKWNNLFVHFARFIDERWYPDYKPSKEAKIAFIKFQSYGLKGLDSNEKQLIQPFLNGQEQKELTIKMLVAEMAEWWQHNSGWYNPLMSVIHWEFKERHIHKDKVFIKALIAIARNCHRNGFDSFLYSFTGLSKEEKAKIIQSKFS